MCVCVDSHAEALTRLRFGRTLREITVRFKASSSMVALFAMQVREHINPITSIWSGRVFIKDYLRQEEQETMKVMMAQIAVRL